jgi:ribosomal protein S18 acetylase RimI-like enzyme
MAELPTGVWCPRELRPDAIRRLDAGLPDDQRAGLAAAVQTIDPVDEELWEGLLAAVTSAAKDAPPIVVGATWVQPTPGNTAVVWPPMARQEMTGTLLRSAAEYCGRRRIALAQLVVAEGDGYPRRQMESSGFTRVAELLYLFAVPACGPKVPMAENVSLAPHAGQHSARLAELIARTYEGTHDCPALDGVRRVEDVLTGYRAQGRYLPEHWYFVQSLGIDVGVLILADHPGSGNWELVYMGLAPEARGAGVGACVVAQALAAAAQGGAERLVLAVDSANRPALAIYQAAGFTEWGRRTAYACLASG